MDSKNVYFEPPSSIQLKYPCIIYGVDDVYMNSADNITYRKVRRYQLTVIDKNPDTDLSDKIIDDLPGCSFERRFKSDNLIHDVLNVYY